MRPTFFLSGIFALALESCAAAGAPPSRGAERASTEDNEPKRVASCDPAPARAPDPLPGWVEGAVVYGVIPSMFGAEHPLRAVTEQLDALDALGVDALWLPPVFATDDPSAISYAITDEFAVRADLGTPADLDALIGAAHARGMKVLLDFVPNHTSRGHPYFRDAEARGTSSEFWSYYQRDPLGRAEFYFDWAHLPNLNYSSEAVQRMMSDAFRYWLSTHHVDGFRVDAAWGVRDRCPGFWPRFMEAMDREHPEAFFIAEASARDEDWMASGFDAAYDWTEKLGEWAFAGVFDDPRDIGPRLNHALRPGPTPPERIVRFLNNNDTGARFVSRYGPARTRLAATLLLTLPGIPVVYTGDEVGAEFEPYEDPAPLDARDPHGLRPLYEALLEFRERLPSLRSGAFEILAVEPQGSAFAFMRRAPDAPPLLVVLNFGEAARLELDLPVDRTRLWKHPKHGRTWCELRTGTSRHLTATSKGRFGLEVRGSEALILMPSEVGGPPCAPPAPPRPRATPDGALR